MQSSNSNFLLSKAWVYYEQGLLTQTLEQRNIIIDTNLGPNEVLIEIKAVGLNPVDIQIGYLSQWIADWIMASGSHRLKIPGADFSGIIYKIGHYVTKYKVGDEVFGLNLSIFGHGCLSQYIKLSENLSSITHKPIHLSHIEAAALPLVFLTAYTALYDWNNYHVDNQKILILGASGGVGHIACQIARTMNKYVVGTCSTQNIEFVKSMGANEVIDYTNSDVVMISKQYGPYDMILDCVGGTQFIPYLNSTILKSTRSLYLTIVGDKTSRDILGGMISYLFSLTMIFRSLKSLIGLGPRYYCINLSTKEENTNQMYHMVNQGLIKPVIDSVYEFSNRVRQAYEHLNTSRVRGKIVIDFNK